MSTEPFTFSARNETIHIDKTLGEDHCACDGNPIPGRPSITFDAPTGPLCICWDCLSEYAPETFLDLMAIAEESGTFD